MEGTEGSLSLEGLLANAGWMRALARTLIADEAQADDIVQQAWLEAVKRPPRDPEAARSWLGRVVRNFAFRHHRDEDRRRRREERAARPDRIVATPEQLLERLELQRQVAEEVAQLDEPYRSTILLHFFEDLDVKSIARAQGLPAETVKTRLRRALDRLRVRFDGRYGGRRAWCLALLPLAAWEVTAASAASAAAVGGGVAGAGVAAGSGITASSTLPILTIGGIVMTQKLIVAFGIVGVLALGAGLGVGRATAPASAQAAMEKYDLVARADLEAMKARYEEARNDLEKLQAEKLEIVKARDDLAGQLEAQAAKAKAAEAEKLAAAARGRSKIPLAFGKYAELSEIQNADWAAMAEATSNMNALLADFAERKKKGQPPAVDWQMKMVEENNKLLKFAVGIMGKLPTHRTGNGEYTHPVVLANLMASMLDRAEMPLSDEQRAGIMALGNEFESEYARFQSSYSGDTLMLEKIVDELALKRDIIDRMQALLTAEQRDLLVNPDLHHRTGMDLLSPMLMTIASIEARTAGSRDEARSQVTKILSDKYELSGDLLAAAQESLDTFLQDLDPLLEPVADPGIPAHVDQAVAAARAEISFLKSLLALPNLSEMTRAAILNEITWILPQVAKRQEGAKEGEAKQPGGDAKQ